MPSFSIFKRHSWFASRVDAYADGELSAAEATRFAEHLATCARCRAVVEDASMLKAALARLPEHLPSRSFRLTPDMVAQHRSAPAIARPTPLYLNLARAGAGLCVVAFAAVLVFGTLGSEDADSGTPGAIQMSADTAGGGSEIASTKDAAPEATAALAPVAEAGASGSGIATPTMVSSRPPAAAATVATPPDSGRAAADGDALSENSAGYAADSAVAERDDGIDILAITLGVAAAGSLLLVAGLEVKRRFNRV